MTVTKTTKVIHEALSSRHVYIPTGIRVMVCDYVECLERCEQKMEMLYSVLEVKYKVLRNVMIDVSFAIHAVRRGPPAHQSNCPFMEYIETVESLTALPDEELVEYSIDELVQMMLIAENCISYFHKFNGMIDEAYFNNFEDSELETITSEIVSFDIHEPV